MIQNILCYAGGAKGDLIVNFLLDKLEFGSMGENKIDFSPIRLMDHNIRYQLYSMEKLENMFLQKTFENEGLIVNSHFLHLLSDEFLQKFGKITNIYLMEYEKYRINVELDGVLKRQYFNDRLTSLIHKKRYKFNNFNHYIDLDMVDYNTLNEMPERKKEVNLTDDMRFEHLHTDLSKVPTPWEKHKEQFFQILSYEKLFLPPYDDMQFLCDKIEKKFDKDKWADAVSKSFLPKEIEVFGKIFRPDDHGYIRY